jgi:protein-arginine kinase
MYHLSALTSSYSIKQVLVTFDIELVVSNLYAGKNALLSNVSVVIRIIPLHQFMEFLVSHLALNPHLLR